MSVKSIKGSSELGAKIKLRRNELGLTIEEAAVKAGVGTKTWSRYESGESIRCDKILSICKTLNWSALPGQEKTEQVFDVEEYKRSEAWPQALADMQGEAAAISFVIGSDILLDHIRQDLERLSHMPKETHIGELEISWLEGVLPAQFLMKYDYDFLYYLKSIVMDYRRKASCRDCFDAHTVLEEIVLYTVMEESRFLMESILPYMQLEEGTADWDTWPFDLFGDMDVVTWLYSGFYLTEDHPYHFEHWREEW